MSLVNELVYRETMTQPNRIIRLEVEESDDRGITFHINGYEIKQWGNLGQYEVQSAKPFASLCLDTAEFSPVGSATDNETLLTMYYKATDSVWTPSQVSYVKQLEGGGMVTELIRKTFVIPGIDQYSEPRPY